MKFLKYITVICAVVFSTSLTAQGEKVKDLMKDAQTAKQMLLERNEGLQDYFDNSAGYVIFPNVGKGGIIIGGSSGNGILYEEGQALGLAHLRKASVGIKAGGQALVEVLFFENETELSNFKDGEYELSASASAVIVESGASINNIFEKGVAVFAMPKAGLMADLSIGGQKFSYENFDYQDSK